MAVSETVNSKQVETLRFFSREREIAQLKEIQSLSLKNAQFTVVTGRRRIGKTHFLLNATENQPTLYFFVARKAESYLCQDFIEEMQVKLNIPLLCEISSFAKLFEYLMIYSKDKPFNLIIDEFQEFYHVSPSVYSKMQHHWDKNKSESKINLMIIEDSLFLQEVKNMLGEEFGKE